MDGYALLGSAGELGMAGPTSGVQWVIMASGGAVIQMESFKDLYVPFVVIHSTTKYNKGRLDDRLAHG